MAPNRRISTPAKKDGEEEEAWNELIKKFVVKINPNMRNKVLGCADSIEQIERQMKLLSNEKSGYRGPILITGPPGTGKTTVVKYLASNYPKINFFYLDCSWISDNLFGHARSRISQLFEEVIQKAPSLVFIDGLDEVCTEKRNDPKDRSFIIVLKDHLKALSMSESAKVQVLAATNKPDAIDPQLRMLFGRDEITFKLPNPEDRKQMLAELTKKYSLVASNEDLQRFADLSHCYSYCDLRELCRKANEICDEEQLTDRDSMEIALSRLKSSKIKAVTTPCAPIRWEDIGGVEDVKRELRESVIWPIEHRDKLEAMRIQSSKGALLYGPPGCSKTMLAQAIATESGYNFISLKGSELYSKYVGDSEKAVERLYRNAREIAPCLIFFDEIDTLAPARTDNQSSSVGEKVVGQLLTEFNGIGPRDNVFTIAATNRPDRVDNALLRPGRLDPVIYIPLPSESDRNEIFKVHMRHLPLKLDKARDVVIRELAHQTKGYSGAEIANICRLAGYSALREDLENTHIRWKHFQDALERVKPRTRLEHLKSYQKFHEMSLQMGQRTSMGPVDAVCDEFDDLNFLD